MSCSSLILLSLTVVLVIVFGICWAPFHTDRLFYSFVVNWTEPLANMFNLIHVVSGNFLFVSQFVQHKQSVPKENSDGYVQSE